MAFRGLQLFKLIRTASIIRHNVTSTSIPPSVEEKFTKSKELKADTEFVYWDDPDTFGTLSGKPKINNTLEDKGDIKEQEFLENLPLPSQKLTISQYANLMKQYLKHKRLKEAMDVLEVRMLTQDRVKPDNYIYNILIGACADVGYTKKAFSLYNDMKKRGLKASGDTYTCLFHACANSPWPIDGLKRATHLRELMIEKSIEPNLTNYNAMIKAFGRCGDLTTAFKIVDEMTSKKIKIRVHTLNHLLHACISDKAAGLRHTLVVWRKMLKLREKPNIFTFNLMLKCVKECNLGSQEETEELIHLIQEQMPFAIEAAKPKVLQIVAKVDDTEINVHDRNTASLEAHEDTGDTKTQHNTNNENCIEISPNTDNNKLEVIDGNVTLQFVERNIPAPKVEERTVPNLLSKIIKMDEVLSLKEVKTLQDKFAIIGGQEDFLKEMEYYSVKPDIKIFTQMLPLLEETREAENKLLESMKSAGIKADIDFYNMLIKKRCLRSDYDGAFEVKDIITKDSKKRHPLKKKQKLNVNIMTYGVLAMACNTREKAEKLLNDMKEDQIKVNIEILGALLRQGTAHTHFGYVLYIMKLVKEENLKVNDVFIKHLEVFNDKCVESIKQNENGPQKRSEKFLKSYYKFLAVYNKWLQEVDLEGALEREHPWQQFRENYPKAVQRENFAIVEPKKFHKRNRQFVYYSPRL